MASLKLMVRAATCSRNLVFRRTFASSRLLSRPDGEDMDDLQKNPYYGKYADKIAKLQKTSPEEFLSKLSALQEVKVPKKGSKQNEPEEKGFSMPSKPKSDIRGGAAGVSQLAEKKLSKIMKVELLGDKDKDEIADIWRQYHANKDAISAVIPGEMWKTMTQRFEEHKTFLFPLPRKEGYELVVVQFQGKEAHFTTLINYQAYKENAPECMAIVHYTELLDTKGIVLMVGEYDKNMMTIQEAQCLANQVEMYYCNPAPEKREIMEIFTHKPDEFKHSDLIAQMENISLLTATPSTSSKPAAAAAAAAAKEAAAAATTEPEPAASQQQKST